MVTYIDKITGNIVKALKENGLRENTLIVWTTDNGTTSRMTGTLKGTPVKGRKGKTSEAGINAPFIVSWPKQIKGGLVSDALIDFTDVLPTFLDLAGRPLDGRYAGQDIHGYSFAKLLKGELDSPRKWIFSMGGGNHAKLTDQGVENQYRYRDRVLRNKHFKLYIDSNKQAAQFYDLQTDPFELNNLIGQLTSEVQKVNFEQLSRLIASFPDEDNDPRYVPNPPQEWDVAVTAESEVWKQ